MTNQQIQNLKPGDCVRQYTLGNPSYEFVIKKVRVVGECISRISGAFGHAYASIDVIWGPHATL